MGKGRDKRKKNAKQDAEHAEKKRDRQLAKQKKHENRVTKKESREAEDVDDKILPEAPQNIPMEVLSETESSDSDLSEHFGAMDLEEPHTDDATPSARAAATLVPHPLLEKSDMLLFGGEYWNGRITAAYGSLYRYNAPTNTWREITPQSTERQTSGSNGHMFSATAGPQARSAHAAVCLPNIGSMIVFGGEYVSPNQKLFQHFSDTWRLDVDKQTIQKSLQHEADGKSTTCYAWARLECGKSLKGKPSARSGHRMAAWNNKVILFGGFYDVDSGPSVKYFNDLWVLENLEPECEPQWRCLDAGASNPTYMSNRPASRSGHCLTVHMDTLFLFGGYSVYYPPAVQTDKNASKTAQGIPILHNDLWKYDLHSGVWTTIKTGLGIPPSPRSGMTIASHPTKGKSFLFGGVKDEITSSGSKRSGASQFFNDLFVFDHKTERFFPVPMKRDAPQTIAEEALLQQDTEATPTLANWYHAESRKGTSTKEFLPCERFNAMLCVLGNNKLYVLGGQRELGSREVTFCDLYSIDVNPKGAFDLLLDMDVAKQTWYGKDDAATDSEWATTIADETTMASSGESDCPSNEAEVGEEAPVKLCQKNIIVGEANAGPKLTASALSEHNEALEETGRRRRVTFQL